MFFNLEIVFMSAINQSSFQDTDVWILLIFLTHSHLDHIKMRSDAKILD